MIAHVIAGRWRWRMLLAAAVFLCTAAPALAQQPIPPLTGGVVDTTATLSSTEREALERKLAAFEERKGSQIAVLLVPTTEPEAIEAYALRVAEAWQIGRGATDDGLVLIVAKDDRRLRIEVGYGLEGAVPDAFSKRIISERIVPRFYEGDFAGGVNDGVDALIALVDGEPLPVPVAEEPRGVSIQGVLPFVFIFIVFVAPLLRRIFGTLFGSVAAASGAGLIAWLVSAALSVAFGVALVVFVLALTGIGGRSGRWASGGWGGMGRRGGGGFGGGGGFRGGGGRFGGGGASGGW